MSDDSAARPSGFRRTALVLLVSSIVGTGAFVLWRALRAVPDPVPVPAAYANARPAPGSLDVAAGKQLFLDNCAHCHDEGGTGHGPGSVGLTTMPAPLSSPGFLAARSDAYLFWRVSEGKAGTPMPSFRQTLSAEERWAIILWLRAGWQR